MSIHSINETKGEIALVLHAHLPYVRSADSGSLEEDWFFQALLECYLPLLQLLEKAAEKGQSPKITIGLSPTLLSLLNDKELSKRFPDWISTRLKLLENTSREFNNASRYLSEFIKTQLNYWENFDGEIISRFANLQHLNVVDLLTCAATHGYLPLLREHPEVIRGQLKTAVTEHSRLLGQPPLGIWLPECAYYEGLDNWIADAGLRYAILDGHGLLHGKPRPRYGIYAPICTKKGIAFFGRDSESTLPVWSAKEGYPGDPSYREFHRDLGWELSEEELNDLGIKSKRPLGLKLHSVTGQLVNLENKSIYNPSEAIARAKLHAKLYLQDRKSQLHRLEAEMKNNPLLVAPFDAELFGHWWFEGPIFLSELFKQAKQENINFTSLRDKLSGTPQIQLCEPSPSSWGQGGYHHYWLNESNAWIVPEWNRASKAIIEICSQDSNVKSHLRLLNQAARELLLAQSSDWSFILRAGTTTDIAKNRIHKHLNHFWDLIQVIKKNKKYKISWLEKFESENNLFPMIRIGDWKKIKS